MREPSGIRFGGPRHVLNETILRTAVWLAVALTLVESRFRSGLPPRILQALRSADTVALKATRRERERHYRIPKG